MANTIELKSIIINNISQRKDKWKIVIYKKSFFVGQMHEILGNQSSQIVYIVCCFKDFSSTIFWVVSYSKTAIKKSNQYESGWNKSKPWRDFYVHSNKFCINTLQNTGNDLVTGIQWTFVGIWHFFLSNCVTKISKKFFHFTVPNPPKKV